MASFAAISKEMYVMLSIVLPNMLQLYITQFVGKVTLALVGRYDPSSTSLAAAALGSMYSNITGLSIGIGMTLALGSFFAQNQGRGAPGENGIIFRHATIAQCGCFVFAVCMAWLSEPMLRALGQPQEILAPVQAFALINAMSFPAVWFSQSCSTALVAQGFNTVGTLAQCVSSAVNFICSWVLLVHGTGFLSIAVGNVLGAWAGVMYMVSFIVFTKRQDTVWSISPKINTQGQLSFVGYVKSALPGALTMWAEWWAAEILALFAGLLGPKGVAANGILFNTLSLFYMTFVAVSQASMLRTGFHLGAKDIRGVKLAIAVSMTLTVLLSGFVAAMLQMLGPRLLTYYTSHAGIISMATGANLGIVLSIPPYAVMMCLMGVFRSAGLQAWAAKAVVISFYCVGIPTGYYLGLVVNVGLLGIWLGNVMALSLSALSLSVKILTVDWHQVSDRESLKSPLLIDVDGCPPTPDTVSVSGSVLFGTPSSMSCGSL